MLPLPRPFPVPILLFHRLVEACEVAQSPRPQSPADRAQLAEMRRRSSSTPAHLFFPSCRLPTGLLQRLFQLSDYLFLLCQRLPELPVLMDSTAVGGVSTSHREVPLTCCSSTCTRRTQRLRQHACSQTLSLESASGHHREQH